MCTSQLYAPFTGGLPRVSATAGSGAGSKATALAVACLSDIMALTLSDAAHAHILAAVESKRPGAQVRVHA